MIVLFGAPSLLLIVIYLMVGGKRKSKSVYLPEYRPGSTHRSTVVDYDWRHYV
jgi:hypothetical protein